MFDGLMNPVTSCKTTPRQKKIAVFIAATWSFGCVGELDLDVARARGGAYRQKLGSLVAGEEERLPQ